LIRACRLVIPMLKLAENPPTRPAGQLLSQFEGTWWVAHTKARVEKALAWEMIAKGVSYFLPMALKTTYSGGRKRKVMSTVFPSYVFFCGTTEVRHWVMTTNRVCQTILVAQREQFVSELEAIDRVLQSKIEVDLYPFATVGRRCRVRQGPMMGIEGTIVRTHDVTRLVLQVSMLGQGAALEISPDLLEPVD
jgi:transcription antitermination factor NusG